MSNSALVNYVKISPNRNTPRNHEIDTVTIHMTEGQVSVETLGDIFAKESRKASCNYGIGSDGRIGMYCPESDRSWCSGNRANDNRAITIECSSNKTAPYAVKEVVYNRLIDLLVDIVKRNPGFKGSLRWKGNKNLVGKIDQQNMSLHKWFENTNCPGEWLESRMDKIAEAVNDRLSAYSADDIVYYMGTKEYKKSIELLKRAVELDPNDFIIIGNLGYSYELAEDYLNAKKWYEYMLKMDNPNAVEYGKQGLEYIKGKY